MSPDKTETPPTGHRPKVGPAGWTPPADGRKQRLLYFTRAVGYEHSAVCRKGDEPSFSEKYLTEMGSRAGFEVQCTKDGRVFDGDLDRYDCLVFYTLGDVTRPDLRHTPPMTLEGKQKLLEAIAAGKGFVGFHAAADTFYGEGLDPYIDMIGAEFCGHGLEQEAAMRVTSPSFPGMQGIGDSFRLFEEWYTFKKIRTDMHVILALETEGMVGKIYDRPPLPATWARMFGSGRVFYTSLGHREDVWAEAVFQQIALGGLAWALGNVDADVTPNFNQVTPKGRQHEKVPYEPGTVSR
ncbi:MAG: hypothetical protein A2V98_24715 [Planctomycetes bacterium RBG_16_64_12]|nr:MAG: hypothetical protein A2V98_24715 [Planctomycetes bacterium RBG_16_64_12]